MRKGPRRILAQTTVYNPHSLTIGVFTTTMAAAAPLLFRSIPFLRFRLQNHRLAVAVCLPTRRPWSTAPEPIRPDENLSSSDEKTSLLNSKQPPKLPRWNNPDYGKWKAKQKEILDDIEPIILRIKEILHSQRYRDGERLDEEDEKVVVDNLLPYHPHSEDKIGCGLDSIMVDRHPIFLHSRCLFVVRTDGGWIDFSYQKCLREYVRRKYPSNAKRFISQHLGLGSIKINTDGGVTSGFGLASFGGVVRSDEGKWIEGFCGYLGAATPLKAELWALRQAMKLCKERGWFAAPIESDCLLAIDLINNADDVDNHPDRSLIIDCKNLKAELESPICHIPREANMVADKLARIGVCQREQLVKMLIPPVEIVGLMFEDINGNGIQRAI